MINHPEVAILALHQIEDTPVVRNKTIVIRSMLNLSLSFDHRVADGYTAVMFTNRMKSLLEKPYRLLTSLK
nr:2-oxo acid dehydrogenase subunit E2 [Geomicrobium sp. JCM 19037]